MTLGRLADERGCLARWISETLRACVRDPKVVAGGGFILFLLVLAVGAPGLAPKDPLEQDLILGVTPPHGFAGAEPGYLLGTDDLGRDVLSRLIWGSRVALTVAFVAATSRRLWAPRSACSQAGIAAGWTRSSLVSSKSGWRSRRCCCRSCWSRSFGAGVGSVIAAIAIIDWTRFCRVDTRRDDGSGEERLCHGRARDRLFARCGY